MNIVLSGIFVYPVKALRGQAREFSTVEPEGLAGDRRWLIVDPDGRFISQRSEPKLARIAARTDDGQLILTAPDRPDLTVVPPDGRQRQIVTVWRDEVSAATADPHASRWLSDFLGRRCHLVWMDDACRRPISGSGGRDGEQVSFADGYPCLVVSEASLADLNGRLTAVVPMDRFRPNLVVSGCAPFAEDTWARLAIGEAVFRNAGPCARCSVTTVDQQSGRRLAPEPLRTLGAYRRTEKGVIFGVNLVVEKPGRIACGDAIHLRG